MPRYQAFSSFLTVMAKDKSMDGGVLIVEDQAVMRALLRDFLHSNFPEPGITEAADGNRALQLVREHRPVVVLMDINLPDANGLELTARIKALHPETQVIIVSHLKGAVFVERALASGASGYVIKDKIYADLLPLIASALASQRTAGEPQ